MLAYIYLFIVMITNQFLNIANFFAM